MGVSKESASNAQHYLFHNIALHVSWRDCSEVSTTNRHWNLAWSVILKTQSLKLPRLPPRLWLVCFSSQAGKSLSCRVHGSQLAQAGVSRLADGLGAHGRILAANPTVQVRDLVNSVRGAVTSPLVWPRNGGSVISSSCSDADASSETDQYR